MAYRQILYQIVFGTKNREATLSQTYSEALYQYIWGIISNQKCNLYRINGMEDHLHIFSDLHPTICLSDYIKNIKVSSNLWMRESGKFPMFAGWQESYAAFTYSVNEKKSVIEYIRNQKQHHKRETFYEEFKRLLIENQIEFDEKYLL